VGAALACPALSALRNVTSNLSKDPSGIWVRTGSAPPDLDFPTDGHAACFRIEDDSFWFEHRTACIHAALARHRWDGPFLDVGGGNGAVSKGLERRGIPCVMLEPGIEGARNAKARGLGDVVCATIEEAAFAPASFGAAGLFDVIEHVADDHALLRAVHRVLRPHGVLAVTVPAHPWLWSAEDEVAGHHRRYTRRSLGAALERAGFEVTYDTYVFAALVPPMFALRALRHRLGRRDDGEVMQTAEAQHTPRRAARLAADALLAPELFAIRRGRRIPTGTTCLAVALAR
jgi:SAM-dependent methyltransferase